MHNKRITGTKTAAGMYEIIMSNIKLMMDRKVAMQLIIMKR